jgi:radical SAM superfamily enzyme YgiQ (UPF0313 family)
VVDEMEDCTRIGIHEFLFYDDTFTVNKERVISICDEIVKRQLDVGWDIRTRVDTVDDEVISSLKKADCQGIHYGVEAGCERVLKVLNKGISLRQVEDTFCLTRKYGIPILAYFMIGNPGETREEIMTTFETMKRLNPDYLHLTIFTPFPGTKIYLDGLKHGDIERDYWEEFAMNLSPDFVPPHWDEVFTRQELERLIVKGYKSFYLRLPYILGRMRRLRSWGELKKKAIGGGKVLVMR